jgi:hypothetical protein
MNIMPVADEPWINGLLWPKVPLSSYIARESIHRKMLAVHLWEIGSKRSESQSVWRHIFRVAQFSPGRDFRSPRVLRFHDRILSVLLVVRIDLTFGSVSFQIGCSGRESNVRFDPREGSDAPAGPSKMGSA